MGERVVVVDCETTGLWRTDRIVEIACVTLDSGRGAIDEWATLVNPMRDVSGDSRSVHGLSASDLSDAPTFEEVAGTVAALVSNAVVAGHNVSFDLRMLQLEYQRLGVGWPTLPAVCTMLWATETGLNGRSLASCCSAAGVSCVPSHSALSDARATAELLLSLLDQRPAFAEVLATNGRHVVDFACPGHGAECQTRQRPEIQAHRESTYLEELVTRLPVHPELSPAQNCYFALLDQALADGVLTIAEQEELATLAEDLGVTNDEVQHAHRIYVEDLFHAAMRDGQITSNERAHLDAVTSALNLANVEFPPNHEPAAIQLEGTVVCFTGDWDGYVDEKEWSRDLAHQIATGVGMVPIDNVTKRCQVLVAGDVTSMSGKARKARDHGIPVISVEEFLAIVADTPL